MDEPLLIVLLVLMVAVLAVQVLLWRRASAPADNRAALDGITNSLTAMDKALATAADRVERAVRDEARQQRDEAGKSARDLRDEVGKSLDRLTQSNESKIDALRTGVEGKLETQRTTVEQKLTQIQEDNTRKLDEIRRAVDEKLQTTLDQRLNESFKRVSDQLEQVYKGLGEMQALATGVGDLKRVLTNVKTRGGWGEIQLGTLLDEILTREQYDTNVVTKPDSNERVEFAIRLPGRDGTGVIWLPIDAKFPLEDYQRIVDASAAADAAALEQAGKALEVRLRGEARDIRDKYVNPPVTTDFGLLFLPTEGLYAEVLRRPGLVEALQREFRVVVSGPTTLAALLNSLQLGFRTLAIEQRSSEVWQVLGAVKTEFGKFGDVLEKVHKKLEEASNAVEGVQQRSRVMGRKLKTVQELPAAEAELLLPAAPTEELAAADEAAENGT